MPDTVKDVVDDEEQAADVVDALLARGSSLVEGTKSTRRRPWHSCSKSCAEVMPRKMVCSKVPLRSKLHNMVSNMVIVEQSIR